MTVARALPAGRPGRAQGKCFQEAQAACGHTKARQDIKSKIRERKMKRHLKLQD